jgi:NADH-quinone oxidoreductase subunit A
MSAFGSSIGIVAYLALFAGVGIIFLFVNLLVGHFVRPADPHEEKLEIYECGEPTIGSSFVQFDLRFYVVALLFIIFDVEVAFFFPWATVFGKATHMAEPSFQVATASASDAGIELTEQGRQMYREMGVRNPTPVSNEVAHRGAKQLARLTLVDIVVFFAVLLVGFAYVWKRGDLDWVRAVSQERTRRLPESPPPNVVEEPVLSA